MTKMPKTIALHQQTQYRIIPSIYMPINFFEDLVDPSEMEVLWEIESMTNERLRAETGDIFLVPAEDRVSGHGSSVIMAAFTHIGKASRFSDGTFGIYYASLSYETAIRETVYHREQFLAATHEPAGEVTMRVYEGKIIQPLHDIRAPQYKKYHRVQEYSESQSYGKQLKDAKSYGLIYNSVRHPGGECIAALRPPAISIPIQSFHLRYAWDG
ncbi:MAG: RES family NAD+ phosphorylase, partial [Pseudomonadota bacterium]